MQDRAEKGARSVLYPQVLQNIDGCVEAVGSGAGDDADEHNLVSLLLAVQRCVSLLRPGQHDSLIAKVLALRPWACPPQLRSALLSLVSHLAVASGQLLPHCLAKLVEWLLPARDAPLGLSAPMGPWAPPQAALEVQNHVLACLLHIVGRVPSSADHVARLLVDTLPPKHADRDALCLHFRAALAFAEDPAGRGQARTVLRGAADRLLAIDVEIKWEDIVERGAGGARGAGAGVKEEVAGEKDDADIFELEGMTEAQLVGLHVEGGGAGEEATGGWEGAGAMRLPLGQGGAGGGVAETAEKLDSLMEQALSHLARRIEAAGGRSSAEGAAASEVWEDVWAVFVSSVLPTHRSKFAQYLVFQALARGPLAWTQRFLEQVSGLMTDPAQPQVLRCACAAYLGSLLARAVFVPERLTLAALEYAVQWCLGYCAELAGAAGSPGGSRFRPHMAVYGDGGGGGTGEAGAAGQHLVLYACTQTVLYVLCYHLEPLITAGGHLADGDSEGPAKAELAARASRLVRGPLAQLLQAVPDPLSHCLPTVAREFARLGSSLGLLEVSGHPAVVEAQLGGAPARRGAERPLEAFFPFDPYLLRRSGALLGLEETYVRWQGRHPRGARGVDSGAGEESGSEGSSGSDESSDSGSDSSSSADTSTSGESMMHVGSMHHMGSMPSSAGGPHSVRDAHALHPAHAARRPGGAKYGRGHGPVPVALASRRKAREAMGASPAGMSPRVEGLTDTPSDFSSLIGSVQMATSVGVSWKAYGPR